VVRSPDQVQPGELLVTTVQHGRLVSRVEPAAPPEAAASGRTQPSSLDAQA
jgi:hypothetical protein